MTNAHAALGVKRKCLSCNAPFFDLQRDPIVCPKCAVVFTPVVLPHRVAFKSRAPIPFIAPLAEAEQPKVAADENESAEQDSDVSDSEPESDAA